ncbi:MAG: aquaporin [Mycetocola sp.]
MVRSGIAAHRLSSDPGLQLLENPLATALGIGVLIVLFAPLSEAHFNPVISIADFITGRKSRTGLSGGALGTYIAAQIAGATCGAVLANVMFATLT